MFLQIRTFSVCAIAVWLSSVAYAESKFPTRENEDEQFSVQFGVFDQSDGAGDLGGNPHIDEEETVFETIILLDKKKSDTDMMHYKFLGDLVSSASVERENNEQFQILQSHPSGNISGEAGIGWSRDLNDHNYGFNGSFRAEYSSFFSIGLGANFSRSIANDNARVRLGYQGNYDTFEHKQFNGIDGDYVERYTHTIDLGLTQTLTPNSILDLSYSFTRQTGVLGTTWYSVFVTGEEQGEQTPSNRNRHSVTLRYKHALSEMSNVEFDYRLYDDSWDLNSDTFEISFQRYLRDKTMLISPRVRYYDQNPVSFFATDFTSAQSFMTSDPDLGAFTGKSIGISGSLLNATWPGNRKSELSLSFDQYERSDGFDLFWTTVGYTTRF